MMSGRAGGPRDKRALIIHADGNLFNNPTLKCVVDLMLARGYEIDFRYPRSDAPMPAVKGLRYLPFGARLWRWKTIVYNRLAFYPLVLAMVLAEKLLLYRRYDVVIAVDRLGLIEAAALHALTGAPYILMSFEIMFAAETSARVKKLERRASRRVAFWTVQDEERAACLQQENGLDAEKLMLLPLASRGPAGPSAARLRDDLKIPSDRNVAMLMGSIADWTMAEDLILSARDWPEDWVLIVHDRYGLTGRRLAPMLERIAPAIGSRIFISAAATDAVDDMSRILSGIDVGLAFYKAVYVGPYLGKNLEHLGLASGKISTFLRHGVPVMTNEIGLYAAKIREHGLGAVVAAAGEIGRALSSFRSETYKDNALAFFARELDFSRYEASFWQRLETARTGRPQAAAGSLEGAS
jgi:hypothetical protein